MGLLRLGLLRLQYGLLGGIGQGDHPREELAQILDGGRLACLPVVFLRQGETLPDDWGHLADVGGDGPPGDPEQMPCVAVIAATIAPAPLDPRADPTLSHAPAPGAKPDPKRTRMSNRIAQGMRTAKYRLADEWEPSAGRVQSIAREVRKKKRKYITSE